jgi:hypothetical protein
LAEGYAADEGIALLRRDPDDDLTDAGMTGGTQE